MAGAERNERHLGHATPPRPFVIRDFENDGIDLLRYVANAGMR